MADIAVLVPFTRQLAATISAGIPLMQALAMVGAERSNRSLRGVVSDLTKQVQEGSSFAEALGKHHSTFPTLYVDVVAAGEASGHLDTMLTSLAAMLEKHQATGRQVRSALVYPAFVFGLTAITAIVFAPGVGSKMVTGTAIALAAWIARRRFLDRPGRPMLDAVPVWTPVLGSLFLKSALARLTRTLGLVVSAGIPIVDALRIAGRASGSRTVYDAAMRSRSYIMRGDSIEAAFEAARAFPPMVVSMAATGEKTGNLDGILVKIADYYEDEVELAVKVAISVLKPALIVLLAGMVLWVGLSVM